MVETQQPLIISEDKWNEINKDKNKNIFKIKTKNCLLNS